MNSFWMDSEFIDRESDPYHVIQNVLRLKSLGSHHLNLKAEAGKSSLERRNCGELLAG